MSSSANNPLNFNWSYNTGTSTLTGFGTMIVSGFNTSSLTVNVSLTNTSALGGQGGERLTTFGFGIDPNATSVGFLDANDGGMINAVMGANFPGYQAVDICAIGGKTCAGGSNGGIYAGASDSFAPAIVVTNGSNNPLGFTWDYDTLGIALMRRRRRHEKPA